MVGSHTTSSSEEARALLQSRVALFWKVMFIVNLVSFALGSVGAIAAPGWDHLLNLLSTCQAGALWWWCHRGRRSFTASRWADAGGLWMNTTIGAFLSRYFAGQFALEQSVGTAQEAVLAEAFISMVLLGGTTMMVAIRAALVPSQPRRTALVTAIAGIPILAAIALLDPTTDALRLRSMGFGSPAWLPLTLALMWSFVIITCTVISWVIYSLRAAVRQARQLGQYALGEKLGEGGMGEVYRARHGMMRRDSAVKLLPPGKSKESDLHRFEQEVQLTAQLTHPNTITIYDYGRTADNVFYYAMELVRGATLERIVALDGAQPQQRVVRVLTMVCGALAEAHEVGLIHRDIKPANIMLCSQGGEQDVVKVLDFGLVKVLDVNPDANQTGINNIVGTPQYMSPEAITDPSTVDARTDLYGLGAVAYYLLAGKNAFEGRSVVEICSKHLHERPAPLSKHGVKVDSELEVIVLSCLEKDPAKRPANARELRHRLMACDTGTWTNEEAETWWTIHRDAIEQEMPQTQSTGLTIARATQNGRAAP
jgi:serine/threonine-protein kinase